MNKILFLDVDGVLNCADTFNKCCFCREVATRLLYALDEDIMPLLKKISTRSAGLPRTDPEIYRRNLTSLPHAPSAQKSKNIPTILLPLRGLSDTLLSVRTFLILLEFYDAKTA